MYNFNPSLSYSEVWLGEYKGSKIAIKMLKDIKDAKATKQFLAEASIMTYANFLIRASFMFTFDISLVEGKDVCVLKGGSNVKYLLSIDVLSLPPPLVHCVMST